ncbi:MAG: SDR family NAD(P)-dependent oxidoreductase [Bacteroidales bacterium]|nr:SDR family NAD(P)-dependent oxidoreductase [Bacteroidales bacterium]
MEQKRAIVMGATSGIGQAVAKKLTKEGWQVGIAGRKLDRLIEMQRKDLDIVAIQQIDVTRDNAPEQLLTLIGKMGGEIDLYFHSSGIGYQNPDLDAEKELATVETNALGMTRMVLTAFKYFESRPEREGQIAVISSIAGTKGLGAAPAYSATKRYVNHYLECLTQLKHIKGLKKLTISDIRPGFVRTPLLNDGGKYPLQLDVEKVAEEIVRKVEKKKQIITVDWRYRILVFFWRLIPRWIWVRLRIISK